jgi:alkylhydroperoxidase family enzyme
MRARVGVVVAAVTAAVLAGCGGSDAPEGSPAPSAATSSAAPSAPPLPAAAEGQGPRAAEAFVRHYVNLINHAIATLDPGPLRAASGNGCSACMAMARATDQLREAGRAYEGGEWSISQMRELSRQSDRRQIRSVIDIADLTVVDSDGSRDEVSGHQTQFTFDIVRRAEGWRVLQMVGVSQ